MRPDRWFAVEWPTRQRMRQSAAQLKMTRTFQFHGDRVLTDSVVAADIASTGPLGIGAQHGWRAVGEPTLVTGSSPNRVDSLDDRPALDVFLEPLGTEPGQLRPEDLPSFALMHPLGLGRHRGEEQIRFRDHRPHRPDGGPGRQADAGQPGRRGNLTRHRTGA
jgi:FIST N domain